MSWTMDVRSGKTWLASKIVAGDTYRRVHDEMERRLEGVLLRSEWRLRRTTDTDVGLSRVVVRSRPNRAARKLRNRS
jgi:hypothetical protein